MLKSIRLAVALGLCATDFAFAAADDDDKVPAAEVPRSRTPSAPSAATDYESVKKEEQGHLIDDAKCDMGTVAIKLRRTTPCF